MSEDDLNSPAQRFVLWNWKTGFEEPLLRTDEAPALSSTDVVYLSSTDVILGLASSAGGGAATDGADCVVEIARASSAVQWRWSWADACASYLEETVEARRLRPFARRRFRIARPDLVFIRSRKPCLRRRLIRLG